MTADEERKHLLNKAVQRLHAVKDDLRYVADGLFTEDPYSSVAEYVQLAQNDVAAVIRKLNLVVVEQVS